MSGQIETRANRQESVLRIPLTRAAVRLFVIGCSTGGPGVLHRIIPYLPKNFPAPVVVVQHMPAGYVKPLVYQLNEASQVTVTVAQDHQALVAGRVYVAPPRHHIGVRYRRRNSLEIVYDDSPPVHGCKPAIDPLAASVARVVGRYAALLILTGMGSDGLQGASLIRAAGGLIAAQDEESSQVFGMPRVVSENGLAHAILQPSSFAPFMCSAAAS